MKTPAPMHLVISLAMSSRLRQAARLGSRLSAVFVLSFAALFAARPADAQTAPLASPNLQFGDGSGTVRTIVPLADGGVLIGGQFERVNGLVRKGVARLNADGTLNTAWNANLDNGQVNALLIVGSNVYVGGTFFMVSDQEQPYLARLALADGSLSPGFTPQLSSSVKALATDGTDLFVGGFFGEVNGQMRNSLARFALPNGALLPWTSYIGRDNFWGEVNSLLIDGGYLYIAGNFDTVAAQPRANLARVAIAGAGTPDAGWIADASSTVEKIAIFGPSLYAGGSFNMLGGIEKLGLARVSTAAGAAVDAAWNPEAFISSTFFVDAAGVVSASFTGDRAGIAEFDLATGALTPWNPTQGNFTSASSFAVAGSRLLVGLQSGDGSTVLHIPRGGSVDPAYRVYAGGDSGTVLAIAHAADGSTFAGGRFRGVEGKALANLVRIRADGSLDTDWDAIPEGSFSGGQVQALLLSGTDLYVGGEFARIGGVARRNLAKLGTGTLAAVDSAWNPDPDDGVKRLATDGTGLYAAGWFDNVSGAPRERLAKLALSGTGAPIPEWNPVWSTTPVIDDLAAGNGALYVAGPFDNGSGQQGLLYKLSAATGERDMAFQPAPNGGVQRLLVVGGTLFAGGYFSKIGGVIQRAIAKLDGATGAADATWMPQLEGSLNDMAHLSGTIVVGSPYAVNGRYTFATSTVVSAASGRPDYAWLPGGTYDPTVLGVRSGSIWYGLNGRSDTRNAIAAFAPPVCIGQPNGASCNAGGVPATCQASICTPALIATSVTVSASPNPSLPGQDVTLSAVVSAAGQVATGTVEFFGKDGGYIGEGQLSSGTATTTTSSRPELSEITAIYRGSPAHLPSRSTTISHVVLLSASRHDISGDGRSDVVWYHTGVGGLIAMNANGLSLGPLYIIDHEPDLNWKVVGTGDLSGDGRADIVWRNGATGAVYGLIMNGSTVVGEGPIHTEPNLNWKVEQIADVDGDGKADLVWRNQATGDVYVMLMNGLSQAGGGVVYTEPNLDWKIVASGDMNGDGRADILWRNQTTGDVFAMMMWGTFVDSGGVIYSEPNTNWKIVGLADFNGDGKADVLWQNTATGDVFEMQMNGTLVSAGQVIYNEPNTAWKIVALGDYNGDGKADILWQNTTTGQVYMMLMNGFAISAANFVYTEPDTQWRIVGP